MVYGTVVPAIYIHIIYRWSTVMSAKIFTMLDSEAEAQGAFAEPLLAKQVRGLYFLLSPLALKQRPNPKKNIVYCEKILWLDTK
jgi:hypothetical protein